MLRPLLCFGGFFPMRIAALIFCFLFFSSASSFAADVELLSSPLSAMTDDTTDYIVSSSLFIDVPVCTNIVFSGYYHVANGNSVYLYFDDTLILSASDRSNGSYIVPITTFAGLHRLVTVSVSSVNDDANNISLYSVKAVGVPDPITLVNHDSQWSFIIGALTSIAFCSSIYMNGVFN